MDIRRYGGNVTVVAEGEATGTKENAVTKYESREMTCKYCGAHFVVRAAAEDLRWYLNCCAACYANDEPGMARYERMADMMGTSWAIEHS